MRRRRVETADFRAHLFEGDLAARPTLETDSAWVSFLPVPVSGGRRLGWFLVSVVRLLDLDGRSR